MGWFTHARDKLEGVAAPIVSTIALGNPMLSGGASAIGGLAGLLGLGGMAGMSGGTGGTGSLGGTMSTFGSPDSTGSPTDLASMLAMMQGQQQGVGGSGASPYLGGDGLA